MATYMEKIIDFPVMILAVSFISLLLSALAGGVLRKRWRRLQEDELGDFGIIQAATLTLLGLLIGFTFSMAISRYDQRKIYEEEEANAIGTEYVRADVLPAADSTRMRELLRKYLDERVRFYNARDPQILRQINISTAQLQNEMWYAVQSRAVAQPTAVTALAVSGMNDVLNSQGYTQAAWWNRIPFEAWVLLTAIAIGCNLLIGYGTRRSSMLLTVVPLAVSLSFFLIADIDSPRGGVIRVEPQNLISLSQSLQAH
jgi:hypothetical protein